MARQKSGLFSFGEWSTAFLGFGSDKGIPGIFSPWLPREVYHLWLLEQKDPLFLRNRRESTFREDGRCVKYIGTHGNSAHDTVHIIGYRDVFIRGGYPGHAVIVADVAVQSQTGEKIFLLAQSFMPAREIHVLENLQGQGLGPLVPAGYRAGRTRPPGPFGSITWGALQNEAIFVCYPPFHG